MIKNFPVFFLISTIFGGVSMSMMRKILPLLLTACLLTAMLPAAALAADTRLAIQLVSGGGAATPII